MLVSVCERFGLVVAGYSGRDESVMKTLSDVLHQKNDAYPGGLFWITRPNTPLLPVRR